MSDVGGIEALMRAAAETEYRARLYGRWKPMDPGRGRGAHGGVRSSVVGGRRLGDQSATAANQDERDLARPGRYYQRTSNSGIREILHRLDDNHSWPEQLSS